eukprot:4222504-Alexandrium_andersonii.AAC.1
MSCVVHCWSVANTQRARGIKSMHSASDGHESMDSLYPQTSIGRAAHSRRHHPCSLLWRVEGAEQSRG